jgi:hypothetical protein
MEGDRVSSALRYKAWIVPERRGDGLAGDPSPASTHSTRESSRPARPGHLNAFNSLTFRNNMDIMALPFIGPFQIRRTPT